MNELRSVIDSYRRLREQQRDLTRQLPPASDESPEAAVERARIEESLGQLAQNVETVKGRIREVATGFSGLDEPAGEGDQFNLQSEIQMLLEPTMVEVREATASTRELADLRGEELRLSNQEKRLQSSIRKLDEAMALSESVSGGDEAEIRDILLSLRKVIESDLSVTEANLAATRFRLDDLQRDRKPLHQQVSDSVVSFFAGRGRSLVLAALLALFSFYFLTFLHKKIFKRVGGHPKAGSSLGFRLAELAFTVFRFLVAIAAVFVVFLIFNDWLLVTVTILVFLAAIWGAKEALVKSYHKVQLLLNLGPVRQGERVLYNGLPYQVRSLSVYPLLENPLLSNSCIRITIEELGEMRMRYDGEDEPWFVTAKSDWVLLSDGTYGEVIFQSPERVRIQDLGGQVKTIPTSDYLALSPTNLSQGFAQAITFGIDYQHQGLDYNEVGAAFAAHCRRKLEEFLPAEEILATFSAFKEAGSSSLDYIVVAKVSGFAQNKRPNIGRALSQGCLDACNENEWGIPFPQLTIHQAGAAS